MSHYGDGRVRKDRAGWRLDIGLGGARIRRRYRTEREARSGLVQLRAERVILAARRPIYDIRPEATYQEAADRLGEWLDAGLDRVRSARTVQSYKQELAAVCAWWGQRRLVDTTPAVLRLYVSTLRNDELSTSTIRHRLDRLAQMHEIAVKEGWIGAVPCEVERPPLVSGRRAPATDRDLQRLVTACNTAEELAVVLLAADAGLRRAELTLVRRQDVRLGAWNGRSGGWITVPVISEAMRPKSGKERRVPILTRRLRDALAALPARTDGRLLPWTGKTQTERVFAAVSERAGLGGRVLMHALRHRWITKLREAGAPSVTVMAWSGHSESRTTDGYTHPSGEVTVSWAAALESSPKRPQRRQDRDASESLTT